MHLGAECFILHHVFKLNASGRLPESRWIQQTNS